MNNKWGLAVQHQEVVPGLRLSWHFDRHIVVYELTKATPEILQVWSATVVQTLKDWNKETPYLALHDLSSSGVATVYASLMNYDMMNIGITDEGREQAEAVLNDHINLQARVAIAFNLTVSGHIGKTLLKHYIDKHPAIQYKSYYSQDAAMRWLSSHLSLSSTSV